MKASIEITDLEAVRSEPRLLRACADAMDALTEGGGTSWWRYVEDRYVQTYNFDGPDELVRDVVTAMMTMKLAAAIESARPIITAGIADDLFRPHPLMRDV